MKKNFFALTIFIVLINIPHQVQAAVTFQSSESKTALLELYTSEGCSSCPPADAWFNQFKNNSGLWKNFVPVAFHVDYWDNLGWRDPWSAKQFTRRQRAYANSWRSETIYTPGFVLNGAEWRNWSGRKLPSATNAKSGILKLSSADTNQWQVSFGLEAGGQQKYDVYAALLVSGLSSDVKSGENSGRRLEHDFVVLKLVKNTLASRDGSFEGAFTLNPGGSQGRFAIAAWITRENRLEPLQATGGWLR